MCVKFNSNIVRIVLNVFIFSSINKVNNIFPDFTFNNLFKLFNNYALSKKCCFEQSWKIFLDTESIRKLQKSIFQWLQKMMNDCHFLKCVNYYILHDTVHESLYLKNCLRLFHVKLCRNNMSKCIYFETQSIGLCQT